MTVRPAHARRHGRRPALQPRAARPRGGRAGRAPWARRRWRRRRRAARRRWPWSSPAPGAAPTAECLWEFGDGETARGPKVRHAYGAGRRLHGASLTVTDAKGAISVGAHEDRREVARRRTRSFAQAHGPGAGARRSPRSRRGPAQLRQRAERRGRRLHRCCRRRRTRWACRPPVWEDDAAGLRDGHASSTPSRWSPRTACIYRHKNIVYCRSILNGELRWKNDLGGRVTWQNWRRAAVPAGGRAGPGRAGVHADVQGRARRWWRWTRSPGQLKWAYGPMVASHARRRRSMRFEAAPAGGPRTVYAGYVLDNIEGDTHTDTEYGVMAFESATGRVQWRRPICRLRPGQVLARASP